MPRFLIWILLGPWSVLVADAATTGRGYDMDYGPFLDYTVQWQTSDTVNKGVTVKLAAGTNTAAVLFDTATLQYVAGWTGWLDLSKTHLATYKGEDNSASYHGRAPSVNCQAGPPSRHPCSYHKRGEFAMAFARPGRPAAHR